MLSGYLRRMMSAIGKEVCVLTLAIRKQRSLYVAGNVGLAWVGEVLARIGMGMG